MIAHCLAHGCIAHISRQEGPARPAFQWRDALWWRSIPSGSLPMESAAAMCCCPDVALFAFGRLGKRTPSACPTSGGQQHRSGEAKRVPVLLLAP